MTAVTQQRSLQRVVDEGHREISMLALSDPDIYALEMTEIFGKSWLLLAHASEIPNPGDYVVRDMGSDNVIVARDRSGDIHVMLNACSHRGMRICTAESGNALAFRCIYHGWAFRHDGAFVGAPAPRLEMQGHVRPKSELGLKRARVALYGGFVFATWELDGTSLEDWLGDFKFYLDPLFLRTDDGLETLGPPQRSIVEANWKTAAESFAGDAYHTLTLHRSLTDMAMLGDESGLLSGMDGIDISANGHSLRLVAPESVVPSLMGRSREGMSALDRLRQTPPPAMTADMVGQLEHRLAPAQLDILSRYSMNIGGIFPNAGFLWVYSPLPDGTVSASLMVHTFIPRGPNKHEFMTWFLSEKCASPALKRQLLETSVRSLGVTGMIEADDTDAWPHMQAVACGAVGREQTLKYHAQLGEVRPPDWPGGGKVYAGFSKDDTQWNWWLHWRDMLQS